MSVLVTLKCRFLVFFPSVWRAGFNLWCPQWCMCIAAVSCTGNTQVFRTPNHEQKDSPRGGKKSTFTVLHHFNYPHPCPFFPYIMWGAEIRRGKAHLNPSDTRLLSKAHQCQRTVWDLVLCAQQLAVGELGRDRGGRNEQAGSRTESPKCSGDHVLVRCASLKG